MKDNYGWKEIMIKSREFITKNNVLFYLIPLIIFINLSIIASRTTIFEDYLRYISIIKYICLFFIILKILACDIKKYTKETYIRVVALIVVSIIVSYISDDRRWLQYIFIIIGAYNIEFKKIAKAVLISESILVMIIILLSIIGIIPNRLYGRMGGLIKRYSLGFNYASYPSLFVWYFTILYLYLRHQKIKVVEYIMLLAANIIVYMITDTRNELLCSIILMVLCIIYRYIKQEKLKKALSYIAKYSFVVFAIISILFVSIYNPNNKTMNKINSMLSKRISLSKEIQDEYGIKLFGNRINWVRKVDVYEGRNENYEFTAVDNSYLIIIYNYGIIMMIIVIYYWQKIVDMEIKNKNYFSLCIAFVIAFHSVLGPQIIQLMYNIFLVLAAKSIIEHDNIIEKLKAKNMNMETKEE